MAHLASPSEVRTQCAASNPLHVHEVVRLQLDSSHHPELCSVCFLNKNLLQQHAQPVHAPASSTVIFIKCLAPRKWWINELELSAQFSNTNIARNV